MPLESVVYVLIRSLRVRRVEPEIVPTRFYNGECGAEEGSRFEVFLRVHIASIRTLLRALIEDAETIEDDELIIIVLRLRSRIHHVVKLCVLTTGIPLTLDETLTREKAIVYVRIRGTALTKDLRKKQQV